jgi:hypothetical protein
MAVTVRDGYSLPFYNLICIEVIKTELKAIIEMKATPVSVSSPVLGARCKVRNN